MLEHANADNRIPVHLITVAKLHRYKTMLHEMGKHRNSVKRQREHLQGQKGSGLQGCFKACCVR